jgi:hypothetical protein
MKEIRKRIKGRGVTFGPALNSAPAHYLSYPKGYPHRLLLPSTGGPYLSGYPLPLVRDLGGHGTCLHRPSPPLVQP